MSQFQRASKVAKDITSLSDLSTPVSRTSAELLRIVWAEDEVFTKGKSGKAVLVGLGLGMPCVGNNVGREMGMEWEWMR